MNYKTMHHEGATKEEAGTFRKVYRKIKDENAELIHDMKCQFEKIEKMLEHIANREISIAKTNLEQAAMWATKGIIIFDENKENK